MTRERAKELLFIIQAYAEGRKLQYKVVGYDDWHDVDDEDGINEGTRYEYRIKPSEIYWEKINRIKPEEDGEITSIEELKEAIFSKKQEISSRGGDDSLFLYITISKNMAKAIEERYSCVFRTDKGCVNTFLGMPFVIGDKTKVEIKDRLIELSKKECEKPASCRFSKKGIELDKVESLLSELSKRGVFILAKEIDARLFPGIDGKLRMEEMDCTIKFFEAENTKEK